MEARDPFFFAAGVPLRTGGHVVGRISTDYEGVTAVKISFVFGPTRAATRRIGILVSYFFYTNNCAERLGKVRSLLKYF